MHSRLLLILTSSLLLTVPALAQDDVLQSNIPDSVRAMIERSQAGNRFEQGARVQVDLLYGDFISGLSGGPRHQEDVENAFVAVLGRRAELSNQVVSGQATPDELDAVSDYGYLRSRMESVLSPGELLLLDRQHASAAELQLRKSYGDQLTRAHTDLTEAEQETLLDTLVRHMQFDSGDVAEAEQVSAEELVTRQMSSLMRAREELQSRFAGAQLEQVNLFLNQLHSNLFLNRSMSDAPR